MIDVFQLESFECDSGNIEKNKLKHNVTIEECEEVFFNPYEAK